MKTTLTSGNLKVSLTLPDKTVVHDVPTTVDSWDTAFANPIGLPPIHQCVVPGDRIVIVIDPDTPQLIELLSALWENLHATVTDELNVTLLLPEDPLNNDWRPLIDEIPTHIREQGSIHIHDSSDENQRSYLASSAGGERIYLAKHLTDADLIVTLGSVGFDSRLGYKGTSSSIFPAFSDADSIRSLRVAGHVELTPDDKRPARDLVDEIGWLLGTQFTVQAIPDSQGGVAQLLCGTPNNVMEMAQTLLKQHHCFDVDDPLKLVVTDVAVSAWSSGWRQFSDALVTASAVLEDGGSIAVVADLSEPDTPGLQMLRRCADPDELLKPLSVEPPLDAVESIQLIHVLQRARVYLLSELPTETVEELGMVPVESEAELQRVTESASMVAALPSANLVWSRLNSAVG